MTQITLKTIAEEAGCSITTVSRALAGYDDVNEDTRQRIIAIANRLGYQPNLAARHLRSKQTNTVGMVVPRTAHYSDPFFMELLAGVGRRASEQGYDLLLSAQMRGEGEIGAYRRMVIGRRIDGMVVARVMEHDRRVTFLQEAGIPFVVSGRSSVQDYPFIDVDGQEGIERLVAHLVQRGHTRIGVVKSPNEYAFTAHRMTGYRAGLDAHGLPYDEALVAEGDLSQPSGADAAGRLLGLPDPPTAIIAFNDMMALGVMAAAQQRGLVVGRDVAVAGFDDIPAAAGATPPLTTLRQPIHNVGYQLAEMLIRLIREEPVESTHVVLKAELVIRASTGG